jgi:hypothetical protein
MLLKHKHALSSWLCQSSEGLTWSTCTVDFTNIAPQTLNGVRILFDVRGTFGAVTQSIGLLLGTFTPGVHIHARGNLGGTVGAATQELRAEREASEPVAIPNRLSRTASLSHGQSRRSLRITRALLFRAARTRLKQSARRARMVIKPRRYRRL